MSRISQSDIQYRPYLHILPWEDSVNQIYNTDPIYIYYQEKTQSIRYTIPTLSTYITHEKTQSIIYTIPTLSTYVTKRRLSQSDIQYWPYLHMLPREDSVAQIYNTGNIYICYDEKTQSIRYTIQALSTYFTMRRLSSSDIQYRSYLHMLPIEDWVNQIYNTDRIYICYHEKIQFIRYTIPVLSTYITKRRLSESDIQYRPYLHMLPKEDSVDQIYNTDPLYICYHEKTQSIRCTITGPIYIYYNAKTKSMRYTIPTLSTCYHEKTQSIRYTIIGPIYIYYHVKTQFIRYTIQTLYTYVSTRRLSRSDIQLTPHLHILSWEDSVNQIYNTDPICICYHDKTQSIRYTIPTLSTYVTKRRLSQSIYNTDPIYIYYLWED
jgi:hypothetical protein